MTYSTHGGEMAAYREEEDPFEEDIVFDQAGLLNNASKMNTAIRRVSSGKCVLFAKTLGLCGAFFGLGLCIAIPGPTYLSPSMELESSLSPIYVVRTSGYVIGSIMGGVLFDRFNRLFLLFLSLLLTAVFITVTPWCQSFLILESCMIILGITMGFLDTGGNVLCLDLWGRNSGPFMQALHFSFGLGAFVAPLLAAPFLESTLVNSTLSTEFAHTVTEFPVHLEDSKSIFYHEGRFRREVESLKGFPDLGSDEIVRNVSNTSLFPDNTVNVSDVTSPLSFTESSTFPSDIHSESVSLSTQSTSPKPKVPKHKPNKIDASKLGNINWDKVHVGIPPAADLLPLTTTSTPPPSPPPLMQSTSPVTTITEASILSPSYTSTSGNTPFPSPTSAFPASSVVVGGTSVSNPTTGSEITGERAEFSSISSKVSNPFSGSTGKIPSSSVATSAFPPVIQSVKSLSSIQSFKDSDLNETLYIMHNTKNGNTDVLKEISTEMGTSENEDSQVLPKKYAFSPVPTRETSGRSNTNLSRKNVMVSSLQWKADNKNISSLDSQQSLKEGNTNSVEHKVPEINFPHFSLEKAVFYDAKEPLSDNVYYENSTPTSTLKNTWLNSNVNGSMEDGRVHSDSFALKPSDENIALRKSEIVTTQDSVPIPTKLEQEDDVSASPVGVISTLATSVPAHHIHHKPGTFDNDTEHINTIFDIFANRIEKYGFNKIQFTYLIVGILVFLISLVFLGFLCHNPRDPKSKQEGLSGKKITNKVVHKLLVALMALFFFLYMGLEVTYGRLVLTPNIFNRYNIHSNLQLFIVFWGSFAAMRFASIFFASGFSPLTMLMLNFAFCTSGSIFVSFLADRFETALRVGTALIGIGLASMFPTGILWIERYIHVSNKVAAVFVIGVALGKLICPITIYKLMDIERMLFMYATLVINIICIFIFILLWWLASRQGEKYSVINNNGYQLANQHDEEEDMMDMSPSGSGVMPRRHCFSSEHRALLNGNIHRGP
ncbi:Uncharacterized protein GBIM_01055 [Gryllus bimaculatus]|nr:Uncharacterized protein GBIM_01055 [Gryllus bimaculatus]